MDPTPKCPEGGVRHVARPYYHGRSMAAVKLGVLNAPGRAYCRPYAGAVVCTHESHLVVWVSRKVPQGRPVDTTVLPRSMPSGGRSQAARWTCAGVSWVQTCVDVSPPYRLGARQRSASTNTANAAPPITPSMTAHTWTANRAARRSSDRIYSLPFVSRRSTSAVSIRNDCSPSAPAINTTAKAIANTGATSVYWTK